jgi:hypothetical protein
MDKQVQLKSFTAPPWWRTTLLWGGGWSPGEDPGAKGWHKRRLDNSGLNQVVIVGIANTAGCFSANLRGDGRIDVTIFFNLSPEQVQEDYVAACLDNVFDMRLDEYPGWGLEVLETYKRLS